jgi:putative hemolysin
MTHRTSITALPITASESAVQELVANARFSRVPVYETNIDRILGVLHIKDFVRQQLSDTTYDLSALLREVMFVPETLPVDELLTTLKRQRQQIAIVMDEHGGTLGLVTFEDLIEEVVGEVLDEFDTDEQPPISIVAPGHIVAQGRVLLDDIEEYVTIDQQEHDVQTIGGLVMAELGRRPTQGDLVTFGPVTLRVEAVERLAVKHVSIRFPPNATAP